MHNRREVSRHGSRYVDVTQRRLVLGYMFALIITTQFSVDEVSGSGLFQLQLTSVQNYNASTVDGAKCLATTPSQCSTFARVCLTNLLPPDAQVDESTPCQYAERYTPVLGANRASFYYSFMPLDDMVLPNDTINVVNLPFTFKWPEQFTLIVELYNDETGQGPQNESPRMLIQRDVIRCTDKCAPSTNWTSRDLTVQYPHHLSLTYEYRIVCDGNHFGPGCDVYCIPSNNFNGHWTCDPKSGSRICIQGWHGNYCTQAACKPGCVTTNARPCVTPGDCTCKLGWQGELCDQCMLALNCSSQHATCTMPGECNCSPGWGGLDCSTDFNYCLHHNPCSNGGTCVNKENEYGFVCQCPIGFTGTSCTTGPPKCTSTSCLNGAQCDSVSGVCVCPSGYTGGHCESVLSTGCDVTGCLNGGECRADNVAKCSCPVGFTGTMCETSISACQLLEPCLNGGSCHVTTNHPGYRCECADRFTGAQCDRTVPTTFLPYFTTYIGDVITTATLPVSATVIPVNSSTENVSSTLTGSAHLSRIAGSNDVTQLLLIVCLGVILPIVVVIATAATWTACRRRANQLRRASSKRQTSTPIISTTLPIVAANLPEAVDNRLNEVHSKTRKKSGCDVDCDVTGSAHHCASPVTLTIVNAVASDAVKGKSGALKAALSASYSRILRDVESDHRECSDKFPDDDQEASSKLKLHGGDLDRSFKNARHAAARNGGDVTCVQISRDVIASEIGPCHFSRDVNVLRSSDFGSCRDHDDVTFAGHAVSFGAPLENVDRYSPMARWPTVSRDTAMTSPNDVMKIPRARRDDNVLNDETEQHSNLRRWRLTSPVADELVVKEPAACWYTNCDGEEEFSAAKCEDADNQALKHEDGHGTYV